MAVPVYATDLSDIITDMASTTGWTAIGTPAALTAPETDYFIQGSNCISKGSWSSAIRGMIYDNGASFTVPTSGAVLIWLAYQATNSLDTTVGGGVRVIIGSGSSDYDHFYVAGSDNLKFDIWRPYVVDPNTATADTTTGTPSGTEQYVGGLADIPAGGPSKGSPFAVDAIRYGRCTLEYTNGQTADYATFDGAAIYGGATTRQWGLLDSVQGVYYMQGFHSFGTATTIVDFRDSNRAIFIRDTVKVVAAFNRLEVLNSSSNVEWTNIAITALGTQSPGTFVVTAGVFTAIGCTFVDMGTFTFLSTSEASTCLFRGCDQITAAGADLTGTGISGYEGASDSSALIWNVATDPNGLLDDMSFTKGTASTHAIEFGTTSPLTMTLTGIDFSGYNAADAQTDSAIYVARTSGTVTINLSKCTGTIKYKSAGATVVMSATVPLVVTVVDVGGTAVVGAQTAIYKVSDDTELMNEDTIAGGIASQDFSYPGSDVDVYIRVRKSSIGTTRYKPAFAGGTIDENGLSVRITLQEEGVS